MTVETQRRRSSRLIYEMAKRPDLQGMRAVAVLVVFADHLFGWPSGGFVGVDVFFVLSGFFITGLLLKERSQTGKVSRKDFYIRRAKRIVPSAVLVLAVTVIVAYLLLPAYRAKESLVDALYAAVFVSNWRFEAVGTDYFQQDLPPSPVQHYWSLSIEEQFYFVWPWVLIALFALTRKVKRRGHVWVRLWTLFGSMFVIVAASFGWAMIQSGTNPTTAYFSTFTRIWELGVGALVAIAGPWLTRIPDLIRPALAYIGLIGVVASLFLINSTSQFPAPWAALPVLSTALVIASFYGSTVRGVPMLTNPVARWFGDISYTLYLWHWPVIILLLAVIPEGLVFSAVAIVLAVGLTAVTYHFYEDPIRRSQWLVEVPARGRMPRLPLSGWALTGATAGALIVTLILYIEQVDRISAAQAGAESAVIVDLAPPPTNDLMVADGTNTPAISVVPGNDPCFGAPAIVNEACQLRNPAVPLQPSIEDFATEWGGPSCWTELEAPLKSCTYGYQGADATRIALVGDSHASRVLHGLAPYLTGNQWHLTTYIGQGCVWMSPPKDTCPAMAEIEKLLVSQQYDLVLTTSTRTGDPGEYPPAWAPVIAAGSRIAVLADNPKASEQAIACLTRVSFGEDRTGECETPEARATPEDPQVTAANRMNPPLHVIDLTPYYCRDGSCPAVIGDVIVYGDISSHLTPTFVRTIAPALANGIRQALGPSN
uniref:Acyltransferase 3 n=2 Tax=unclassified Mycobacterium TaxID=2642494 RepID=A0A5Q5BFV6_MYCSS